MLMGETLSLKLSLSLSSSPVILFEQANVLIRTFCDERARTDRPVAPVGGLGLAMTFMEDNGMYSVYFR